MNHPSGQPQNELPWSAGFCDCCSDLKTCLQTYIYLKRYYVTSNNVEKHCRMVQHAGQVGHYTH
ncbi:protein PLANT CADMIUM RESISTANCE 2-like [Gossypium australe]|uniref:Protein PLANT CADMIUM RESISTANCE 2-like n=1 Tax=Gossypium australe TaxID=47621 RepID=A0A5B6VA11_9ROSI|nr:protein PLANT CADMIUM RESISTANCE 2-like [Gossypium australe]